MTKIQVTNGQGRPKNPHVYYENDPFLSYAYTSFEQSVQYHEAPGIPDGDAEGELVWQYLYYGPVSTFWKDNDTGLDLSKPNKLPATRQIWVIKSEKEERYLSLKASMKFDRLIHGNTKQTGEGKSELIGHYVYDHENQTETFIPAESTPPVSKEEGKTAEEYLTENTANWFDHFNGAYVCDKKDAIQAMQAYADQELSSQKAEVERLNQIILDNNEKITELNAIIDTLITGLP